jgi:hypothetical protein
MNRDSARKGIVESRDVGYDARLIISAEPTRTILNRRPERRLPTRLRLDALPRDRR